MYPPTGCNNTAVKRKLQCATATSTLAIIPAQEDARIFQKPLQPRILMAHSSHLRWLWCLCSRKWYVDTSGGGHTPHAQIGVRVFRMECSVLRVQKWNYAADHLTKIIISFRTISCWNKRWLFKQYLWLSKVYLPDWVTSVRYHGT